MNVKRQKKVFLYAYDKVNLGDDLFVHTIVNRYPHVQFYLWTNRENIQTFSSLKNLKILDQDNKLSCFLHTVRDSFFARYRTWLETRCDASVYIGGSIFMEYPNWPQFVEWWKYKAGLHPFFVLGANFGPYHTKEYPVQLAEAFPMLADVCFRDHYSVAQFPNCPTVRYAPDILFSTPLPKKNPVEKQIFISVINCSGRDQSHSLSNFHEKYIRDMAALLTCYLKDGYSLILSSFCQAEGDDQAIQSILETAGAVNHPAVSCLNYDGTNLEHILSSIVSSEYIIASRFHATILALSAGRPVLPIIYSDKTLHVLEDLNFRGEIFDLRDREPWEYQRSRINLESAPFSLPAQVKTDALGHFKLLDQFLQEA